MSKFIIGDVHGCLDTLMALLAKLPIKDYKDLVFCGDLIDRGPRSMEVVEFVKSHGIDCVKGNHEDLMIKSTDNEMIYGHYATLVWERNGGFQTQKSYQTNPSLILEHVTWMRSLPLYLEYPEIKNPDGRYLVVSHSNIGKVWDWSPDRREKMKDCFEEEIMWGRYGHEDAPEIYNVVGHTIQEEPKIKSFYACIDTDVRHGKLTCLQFPEMVLFQQESID